MHSSQRSRDIDVALKRFAILLDELNPRIELVSYHGGAFSDCLVCDGQIDFE